MRCALSCAALAAAPLAAQSATQPSHQVLEFEPFVTIQRNSVPDTRFHFCELPWDRNQLRVGLRAAAFPFARARRIGLEVQMMIPSGSFVGCAIPLLPPPPNGVARSATPLLTLEGGQGLYGAARMAVRLFDAPRMSGTVAGGVAFMMGVGRPLGSVGAQVNAGGTSVRAMVAVDWFGTRIPFRLNSEVRRDGVVVSRSTERASASVTGAFIRAGLTFLVAG
jgi:hypothetical protein